MPLALPGLGRGEAGSGSRVPSQWRLTAPVPPDAPLAVAQRHGLRPLGQAEVHPAALALAAPGRAAVHQPPGSASGSAPPARRSRRGRGYVDDAARVHAHVTPEHLVAQDCQHEGLGPQQLFTGHAAHRTSARSIRDLLVRGLLEGVRTGRKVRGVKLTILEAAAGSGVPLVYGALLTDRAPRGRAAEVVLHDLDERRLCARSPGSLAGAGRRHPRRAPAVTATTDHLDEALRGADFVFSADPCRRPPGAGGRRTGSRSRKACWARRPSAPAGSPTVCAPSPSPSTSPGAWPASPPAPGSSTSPTRPAPPPPPDVPPSRRPRHRYLRLTGGPPAAVSPVSSAPTRGRPSPTRRPQPPRLQVRGLADRRT